jgi:hypothetical protein
VSCVTCGAPCNEDGACTYALGFPNSIYDHLGAGTDPLADTQERLRAFLSHNDDFADEAPMWMCAGIRVTWGDLRVLADYETPQTDESNHRT